MCRRASSLLRYVDIVVGGIPSRSASRVGVTGWNARMALATAKPFGLSLSRRRAVSTRSFASCPRMKSRNSTFRRRESLLIINYDLVVEYYDFVAHGRRYAQEHSRIGSADRGSGGSGGRRVDTRARPHH